MKITIITVVFNGEKTIARTLKSVIAQNHVGVEHIIVDGASTDGTLSVLEKFQKNISKLISEPDKGIYDAMNKGLKLASGEIIGILNADDYYANPNVLKDICHIFESPEIDAVYGNVEYFSSANPEYVIRIYSSAHFHPDKLSIGVMPAHPALFLRKRVYEKYGLFDINYKIAGDFDLIARIFKDGNLKSIYVPRVLTRMQTGGVSNKSIGNTILLNKEILCSCRNLKIPTNYFKLLTRYPRKFLEYIRWK